MPKARRMSQGFTLVELLVVLGIIAILTALTIPSIIGIVRSSSLTTGSNALTNQLTFARQYAMAKNCQVEFRLYQLPDPTTPSSTTPAVFRAFQSLAVPTDGSADTAITKVTFLPVQIYMVNNITVSSLLQAPASQSSPTYVAGATAAVPLGTYAPSSYNYYAFHFKPDGSTDLNPSGNTWFVSLANQHDTLQAATGVPTNFVTIQVNALTGRVQSFRP